MALPSGRLSHEGRLFLAPPAAAHTFGILDIDGGGIRGKWRAAVVSKQENKSVFLQEAKRPGEDLPENNQTLLIS
jgi:hypothetical protein